MKYSRQIILDEIGKEGQKKLKNSVVAIVGVGAIGSVSAELLTRAGIGKLITIDRDIVEENNLQRQTLYGESDVGKSKAMQARDHLPRMNSEVEIEAHAVDLDHKNINLLDEADIILDGTDNLETRYLLDEYCVKNKKPWIYAAAVKTKGFVFNILPGKACLRDFLDDAEAQGSCDTLGILNTLSNMVASIQVTEAIKILLGKKAEENLLFIDIWKNNIEKIKVEKKQRKETFEYLEGKKEEIVKFCGSYSYQIKNKIDLKKLKDKLEKIGKINDLGYAITFDKITVFEDRALIKAKSKEEAKSIYSKFVGN